jgi:hypothetical protein
MKGLVICVTLALLTGAAMSPGQDKLKKESPPKDFTNVPPAELGIEPVKPMKDAKTGFVVGGKNATATIRALPEINGLKIATLEKIMRPKMLSTAGFLGPDESLLEVLVADNDYVVGELKLTHQALARPMLVAAAVGKKQGGVLHDAVTFRYHGRDYRVKLTVFRGKITSPFQDETSTNTEATVENLTSGKKVSYSLLVPEMVRRYGFYEGTGTKYRVDPRRVVEVFDFLKRDSAK